MSLVQVPPDFSLARSEFPILKTLVNGNTLAYLDNAATSQKPESVIKALDRYWTTQNANVHRGVHHLSVVATQEFDRARELVRTLLNAHHTNEIIFTKGCTESINLVSAGLTSTAPSQATDGQKRTAWIGPGDEILLSTLEHHSNIVPWQMAAEKVGATVRVIPITDDGVIDQEAYLKLLNERTKLVGIVHVSNVLGTVNPVKSMIEAAHRVGALVLVDGAQAGPHLLIDVQDLDADFYTLSCHKIYAPTGVGVLYGKQSLLESMPPYHGGGDMIRSVSFGRSTYADLPAKFEAGTPNVAGVVGLGAAIEYLIALGSDLSSESTDQRLSLASAFNAIQAHEARLSAQAESGLSQIAGLKIFGNASSKAGITSFTLDCAHPHDIGTILDHQGIAIRAGHHCCMPLMERLGIPATARASYAFYNTIEEVDRLVNGVKEVVRMFS